MGTGLLGGVLVVGGARAVVLALAGLVIDDVVADGDGSSDIVLPSRVTDWSDRTRADSVPLLAEELPPPLLEAPQAAS